MPILPPSTGRTPEDKKQLRDLLSWSARHGFGPKFGTTTVSHYQNTHFTRLKGLGALIGIYDPSRSRWTGRNAEVRVRDGEIQYRLFSPKGDAPEKFTRWNVAANAEKFARFGRRSVRY
ncbi:hypothetical protein [Salinibacter phage M8CC-19]|uniref:Uncharacterized protein n=2 Tax=Kryptosalinivirus M8CC19 TaxID=2560720 RepID=A0A2I6UG89_9CAUD|nr:hypothetical protein FGG63_gp72 [Salinibacter phage M8CC-19]AUO78995.1 hypothetical protein [Salinibacter phage M8CC-19]AUO79230.1 hypothetical protein [Salinibacter phage M31CC-1]